jgi:hypothetical protein
MPSPPGYDLVTRFRDRILEQWAIARTKVGTPDCNDLLAVLDETGDEVRLVIGKRADIIASIIEQGIDFSRSPEILQPAHKREPAVEPGQGLWVLVYIEGGVGILRIIDVPSFEGIPMSKGGSA